MSTQIETTIHRYNWKSPVEVIEAVKKQVSTVAAKGKGWLLIHADFAVGFGTADTSHVDTFPEAMELLDPDFLQEFRLFGTEGEWHIWRKGAEFRGRLCTDSHLTSKDYIEEYQALWGTKILSTSESPEGWTTIYEDRGTLLHIPAHLTTLASGKRVRLCVRHYLKRDIHTALTAITDSRLVALCDSQMKPIS